MVCKEIWSRFLHEVNFFPFLPMGVASLAGAGGVQTNGCLLTASLDCLSGSSAK
jgi:hypothetical protein